MAVTFTRPTKIKTYELASSKAARKENPQREAAECWVRGRLTFDQKSEIEAAQHEVRLVVNPLTLRLEERRIMSVPRMRRECVWQLLEDSKAGSNWVDEKGTALDHRRAVLNEYLDPDDLADLGNTWLLEHFPEYFGAAAEEEETESAEGNPTPDSATPESPPSKRSREGKTE